ncbi:serine hydrolase domain-containing protein [Legionella taurinensis]|uniref:Class A beta-lactamase-related serine hydrolase n=1 Tax=Legionella taurinensis TaxID=70611 RepID=A0A3A5LHJ8_9GAMM|nr:serine hydrolase domain-containing protein [Legionella taurinensis]RJT46649.1 class A beta-lactamase-related serine hydrolase [Legionella taurinensis]RJT66575.1 class A beta-lactamase-related serine hydrolase [Legionella taurinensis]STY25221.1 Beta-lactamase [Legionella taurinensis]
MPKPSVSTLQKIAEPAHIPGVSYSYVEPKEGSEHEFVSTSLAIGKKATDAGMNGVDNDTQFPASSLSKIVFTYLVLQLVKDNQIDLDEPLLSILQQEGQEYERFKVNGEYPEKATQLTARQVLSHTTGLPNFGAGSDLSSPLSFADDSELGKGYSYSGEAILYLQKVIETKMGKNLETLAKEYVFDPLKMDRSTFLPQPDSDTNIVSVHTELGKPTSIYESIPNLRYGLELMSSLSTLSQSENGKIYLSENPREYYVKGMSEPASIPPEIDLTNLATKLNNLSFKSDILAMTSKAGHTPHLNAAGTLLTSADDFSKFMTAWLKNMDDPTFQQAFEFETSLALSGLTPEELHRLRNDDNTQKYLKSATDKNYKRVPFNQTEFDDLKRAIDESTQAEIKDLSAKLVFEPTRTYSITKTCGLGWHLYKNADKVIAYQYGENLNTRSFIAINVTDKKGAAFFTNSEHGMSIATQILSSPDLAPIGDIQELFKHMPHYTQSDEPGWKETIEGMLAEDQGDVESVERARSCFAEAIVSSPNDKSKQLRLEWFNLAHQSTHEEKEFTPSLETFEGVYKNPFSEKREIYSKDGALICKEFDREIKLVRISDTDFLPEKNQDFKISIKGDQVTIHFIHSDPKFLFEQSLPESREHSSFFAAISKLSGHQPAHEVQAQNTDGVDVPVHETQKGTKLESAQDLTQRFRKALDNVRHEEVEPSAAEEAVEKNSSPSPFSNLIV